MATSNGTNGRNYYVYQYLTEDDIPYYIGKGKGNRINCKHKVALPSAARRVIIKNNLTNEEAKEFEKELITKYGRKIDGGILDNIKINQWACHAGWKHSKETKKIISEKNKGLKRTDEQKKNYKGTTSREVADKIAKTLRGRSRSDDVKKKISESLIGRKLSLASIAKRTESFNKTIAKRQEEELTNPALSTDRKEKKKKAASGKNNGMYGKKLSVETIAKRQAAYKITIEARKASKFKELNNGN